MRLDLENLPSDVALLHRLVSDMAVVVETRDDEIERLRRIVKQLQRARTRNASSRRPIVLAPQCRALPGNMG